MGGMGKMDCDTAGYKQERYDEISNEMKSMLIKVGWKKDFIEKNTPVLPISGWMGDNLLKKSENMPWWKGTKVFVETTEFHVDTLYDVLDKVCKVPSRPLSAAMRMPISGIYKIKGVGDVLAAFQPSNGRWEKKLAVRSWMTPIRSSPTRWPSAA